MSRNTEDGSSDDMLFKTFEIPEKEQQEMIDSIDQQIVRDINLFPPETRPLTFHDLAESTIQDVIAHKRAELEAEYDKRLNAYIAENLTAVSENVKLKEEVKYLKSELESSRRRFEQLNWELNKATREKLEK